MSTIDPIVSGGVGSFGSTPLSIIGAPGGTSGGDGIWTVLAQLLLDSGPEYLAVRGLDLLGRTYVGRVQRWGRVEKSIAPLSGMPQTGDAVFRIADTDYRWRDLAVAQPLRGRTIRLKFVKADATADDFQPFFTGEIFKLSAGPGYIEITARDMSWAWMDENIQPLLTSANFPYIAPESDGSFAKILIGSISHDSVSSLPIGPDQYGAIELTHMGLVGSVDRFSVARHTIFDITVYRRTSADGTSYVAVDPSEYNVTVENLIVDGYTYEMTFVDFLAVQESGVSIRANVDGLYFRPAFGEYPAAGFDPVLNPTGVPAVLKNPIDGILNLARLEFRKATLFDHDGIMAIHALFANVPLLAGGFAAYEAAGAVTESETPRSILGKYLPCFNLDMYHGRAGEIALSFTDSSPVARPFFSDNRHDGARQMIVRESFFEDDPSPAANRCVLPSYRHYAAGTWLWTGTYDNFTDQSALAVPRRNSDDSVVYSDGIAVRDPRIEPMTSEIWFSRNARTIYDVATRRMSYASLGSTQPYFDLMTPEVIEDIELAKRILVTHRAGRASGGYRLEELKIISMALDLAAFRTTVSTIRGVPGTVLTFSGGGGVPPGGVVVTGSLTIDVVSELTAAESGYSFIASASAASPDTHSATTIPVDMSGADLIIAAIANYGFSGGSTITDNYGNSWHTSPPTLLPDTDSLLEMAQIWYCKPTSIGPLYAVTASDVNPALPAQPSIAIAGFRGSKAAAPFDQENGSFATVVDSLQPGSVTPSEDLELIVTALVSDTARPTVSMSIDSGFSIVENVPQIPTAYGVALAYLIQSAAAPVNPLWDTGVVTGGDLTSVIATFKAE